MTTADLPALNAALNATAAVLLVIGFFFIKAGRIQAHKRMMLSAFITSGLFLTSYVVYHAQVGSKPFPGTGVLRTISLRDSDPSRDAGSRRLAARTHHAQARTGAQRRRPPSNREDHAADLVVRLGNGCDCVRDAVSTPLIPEFEITSGRRASPDSREDGNIESLEIPVARQEARDLLDIARVL
jgi:hypothetical protein